MGKWRRVGLVIRPNKSLSWMQTHCMMPTPLHLYDDVYKIFFGSRNSENQSSIGYAIIDLNDPTEIIEYSREPVLSPGRLGTFDDNGVLPSCVVTVEGSQYLFYVGFKPGGTTRMDLFGGLALSEDSGKSFLRWSEAPILGRNKVNPFINTAPWVVKYRGEYLMYYVAGVEWIDKDLPRYNIQIASSKNCLDWDRKGKVVIDFENHENALARPYVILEDGLLKMWFSSKGKNYRFKYADSTDGVNWSRKRIDFYSSSSLSKIDNEMTCYPVFLRNKEKSYVLYNGNNYGLEGICLAIKD